MKNETTIKKIDNIIKNNNSNKVVLLKLFLDNECKKENPNTGCMVKFTPFYNDIK